MPFIPKCRCRNKIFVPADMAGAISRNSGDKRSWYEERNRVFLEPPLMISVFVVYVITVSENRNSQIALVEMTGAAQVEDAALADGQVLQRRGMPVPQQLIHEQPLAQPSVADADGRDVQGLHEGFQNGAAGQDDIGAFGI